MAAYKCSVSTSISSLLIAMHIFIRFSYLKLLPLKKSLWSVNHSPMGYAFHLAGDRHD